ncbi:uncharacterized protein J4E79_005418 [Alternaria viburni]|uniref:uncharacterized protein n=1 Tax=Alternaria viburni TaxID=566460 RepID=UPI0020C1DA29|nr:uncharacterized protein J4E79_005418 [Alternaria viburni]KAI4660850.1 hypothetical protein J4E79_005418 [Alternaria viburni]
MPPTVTTSTSSGTPTAIPIIATPTPSNGFNGEEFINNLGSDLAPLLTLFGEQVTKQFLSMSLGWADHILLAVGPLGIITTVVSAIRVSNVRVLKAIIGRAREKLATAELELLSSTSDATSELWTEEGIVRQPGHATILELVAYRCKSREMITNQDGIDLGLPGEIHIGNLSEAYNVGVLRPSPEGPSTKFKDFIEGFKRKYWPASPVPNKSKTLKHLARLHTEIVMNSAEIASKKAELSEIDLAESPRSGVQIPTDKTLLLFKIAEKNSMVRVAQRLVSKLAIQPPNLILNVHNTLPKSRELWVFATLGLALQFVAVAIPAITTYHWKKPKDSKPVHDYAYPTFLLGTCLLVVSIALCSYVIEATTVEQVFTPTGDYLVKRIFRLQLQQDMGDQPFKAYVILNDAEDKEIRTSRYDPEEKDEHAPNSRTETQKSTVIVAVALSFTGADPLSIGDPRIVLRRKLQSFSSKDDADLAPISNALGRAIGDLHRTFRSYSIDGTVEWVHIVESRLNDSSVRYGRLKLMTTTGYMDEKALHAILALWRYAKPMTGRTICVVKAFSVEDWTKKVEFLEALIDAKASYAFPLNNGHKIVSPVGEGEAEEWASPVREGEAEEWATQKDDCEYTGLSIESMLGLTKPLAAYADPFPGYLAVDVGTRAAHFAFELLAGFMDALWEKLDLRYHDEAGNWSAKWSERRIPLEVDGIVDILMDSKLVSNHTDAKILVFSSLARCTVWKDSSKPDESTPTADRQSEMAPPTGSDTQDKSPHEERA